jgi:hypothetical protein
VLLLEPMQAAAEGARDRRRRVWRVGASVLALAGAAALAHWRPWLLGGDIPSFCGGWLLVGQGKGLAAARIGLAVLLLLPLGGLTRTGQRLLRGVGVSVLTVGWLLLLMNYGCYAANEVVLKAHQRRWRVMAGKIQRKAPSGDRLLILMDDLPEQLYFHAQFRIGGQAAYLRPAGQPWFARPLKVASDGKILSPMDQERTWLLANARWRISAKPVVRLGRYNLYDLGGYPPAKIDLQQLRQTLQGMVETPSPADARGFPQGFDLTWLAVEPPRSWRAGDRAEVCVKIRNDSPFPLRPGDLRYAIGYHWSNFPLTGRWQAAVWDDGNYTFLPDELAPGQTTRLKVSVRVPDQPSPDWVLSLSPILVGDYERRWTAGDQEKALPVTVESER